MENESIQSNIKILDEDKYTLLRREFHKIPEVAFNEHETHKLILSTLTSLENFEKYSTVTKIGATGIYIDIPGQGPALSNYTFYSIGLRADMDGLPLPEANNIPYKSINDGTMHGCGHDGHMTILIATIERYLANIKKIPGNFSVRFIFQPAEEIGEGALALIEGRVLENISEIYGLHNMPYFPVGTLEVISGPIMARVDTFEITIIGKGGHSSVPFACRNPINTGVEMITAIDEISSQEMKPDEIHAIAVCSFQAGYASNVIPDTAIIKGTVRSLKNEVAEKIIGRIKEICWNNLKMSHCQAKFDSSYGNAVINHEDEANMVDEIAKKYFISLKKGLPLMLSEDFAYYLEKLPGCFFFIGIADEEHKNMDLHSSKYDFNDKAIPIGVEAFLRIIEKRAQVKIL